MKLRQKLALVDDKFIDLKTKNDEINGVAYWTEKTTITDLIDDIIDKGNPFQNFGTEDIWIEDDIFDKNDSKETIEISKDILKDINKNDPFLDFNVLAEEIISEIFDNVNFTDDELTIEDVTDDKIVSDSVLSADEDAEEILAVPATVQGVLKKQLFLQVLGREHVFSQIIVVGLGQQTK